MRLYILNGRWKNLQELAENEEVDKQVLYESLNEIEEQMDEKYENIGKVIKGLDMESKAIKEEEARLAKRRRAIERNSKNLKEYLAESLIQRGLHKIKTKLFTVYFRKNKKMIFDEDLIDSKYKKLVEQIDIASIRVDLQEGKEVAGARFEENESLVIQ